jgi:succinate--hydroxymethylglutarate CoA-transferase
MSTYIPAFQSLYRPKTVRALSKVNGFAGARNGSKRRNFATVAIEDGSLPLKGYRLLDMTRVLAGVRQ